MNNEQIHKNLEDAKNILLNQTENDALEFSDWTKEKASVKYTKKMPTFAITNNFIYWCDLGINIGSEQNKIRPVLVVRTQTNSPICTILPLTSVRMNDNRWYHVDLEKQNSTALVEQLRNVSKLRILNPKRTNGFLDRITPKDLDKINNSLHNFYKLEPFPTKK